jgi:AbrB family looped-hinge helix DNA binding protein
MATCKIDNQGRIVVPATWRESQGATPGQELVVLEEDGRLIIQTRAQAVREAQEIVRRGVPAGVSLVGELLRERRASVAREQQAAQGRRRHRG